MNNFKDLVFCPLDLPQPPSIDVEKFIDWMQRQYDKRGPTPQQKMFEDTGRHYPWLPFALCNEDVRELGEEFPEVLEYFLHLMPFKKLFRLVFLAQRGKAAVFPHADTDEFLGFRTYLTAKSAESLYFHKSLQKEEFFYPYGRTRDGKVLPINLNEKFDMGTKHYASFPENCKTFMLNSVRAVHGVDENECSLGDRIAVLVQGEVDEDASNALLERSSIKYAKHAIWY